jgi:hypothetical protein
LNTQNSDLINCPVCGYILWKPVTCSLCENSFCFQCIQIWIFEQQEQIIEYIYNENENENDYLTKSLSLIRCPFNCSPYKQRKCPPLLSSILSKLTIECRNKVYGCQQILFYEQLEKHEEELCQYKIVRCPGCKQDMFKELFDKSEHLLKCLYVELQCTKCESTFQRKDQHNQLNCMEKQICLLKQQLRTFQQKSTNIFDIQRKKIDILDEKLNIIEDIWGNDDDDDSQQIHETINPISNSIQVRSEWKVIIGIEIIILSIFILLIYIKSFIC